MTGTAIVLLCIIVGLLVSLAYFFTKNEDNESDKNMYREYLQESRKDTDKALKIIDILRQDMRKMLEIDTDCDECDDDEEWTEEATKFMRVGNKVFNTDRIRLVEFDGEINNPETGKTNEAIEIHMDDGSSWKYSYDEETEQKQFIDNICAALDTDCVDIETDDEDKNE